MSLEEDIRWFKQQFLRKIEEAVQGTPLQPDLLVAIAVQETGYIWRNLCKKMSASELLKLCVGDTIDAPNRSAFPKTKAELLSVSNGDKMFSIARESLELMAKHVPGYESSVRNPDKFCHGFGIFQYDLQFLKENSSFFLERKWHSFDRCLEMCVRELKQALKRAYGSNKNRLSDEEMVYVAIAYNRGTVEWSRGVRQGYFDGKKYYGEYIRDYLQISKSILLRETPMSKPNNSFKTLGGYVPVNYDRKPPQYDLGSRGMPTTWHCTEDFEKKMDDCFAELWKKCPLGKADIICTAGAWVPKPGMHGQGRAFDLDAIWWGDRLLLAKNYPSDKVAYLGVESVLRKHFGTVLNYKYNAAHQCHWHFDDGTSVGFRTMSSVVLYLQMTLNEVFKVNKPLMVDGDYGDNTRGGVRQALKDCGLVNVADVSSNSKLDQALTDNWMAFLDEAAKRGLAVLKPAGEEEEESASDLLERLYDVINEEIGNSAARKTIESALTIFVSHPTIEKALEQ